MPDSTCSIDGCEKKVKARGWCAMHYMRWTTHGDPEFVKPKRTEFPCTIDDCEKPQFARGWCSTHYHRWRNYGDVNVEISRSGVKMSLEDAFAFYMRSEIPETGCWDWAGPRFTTGMKYGALKVDGKTWVAHRVSYAIHLGEIPEGLKVRHTCDRPVCVQPKHLLLGTNQDNSNDAVERGRRPVGEANKQSHLTEADVLEIRRLHATGEWMYTTIGAKYGVAANTIKAIVIRKTWKHI